MALDSVDLTELQDRIRLIQDEIDVICKRIGDDLVLLGRKKAESDEISSELTRRSTSK